MTERDPLYNTGEENSVSLSHENTIGYDGIFECIIEKFEKLSEKEFKKIRNRLYLGYVEGDKDNSDDPNSIEDIVNDIRNTSDTLEQVSKINEILLFIGIGVISTNADWLIARVGGIVEESLGLVQNGFIEAQDILSEKYGWEKPIHLDKGFGNGKRIEDLSHAISITPGKPKWRHIGIADRVHFSIKDVLLQFRNKRDRCDIFQEIQEDFIGLFSIMIGQFLKGQWKRDIDLSSQEQMNHVSKFISFFNDDASIFIAAMYSEGTGKFKVSIDDEFDSEKYFDPQMDYLMLRFLQKNHDDAVTIVLNRTENIGKNNDFGLELLNRELDFDSGFLSNFFNYEFLSEGVNFNRKLVSYLKNTYIGKFTDIRKIYSSESIHMITSVRSDSHESDEDFEKDILGNIDVLAPGGLIISDGQRQSFTRIQRIDILRKIANQSDNIELSFVVGPDGLPVSFMIQKKHPNGYLGIEEKKKILKDESVIYSDDEEVILYHGSPITQYKGFSIQTHIDIEENTKVAVDTVLRRSIFHKDMDNIKVFHGLHASVRKAVEKALQHIDGVEGGEKYYKKVLGRLVR